MEILDSTIYEDTIRRALLLLKLNSPSLFPKIQKIVKDVIFFTGDNGYSFVKQVTPNSIFIHVKEEPSVCFIVEELAHQGGHLIFWSLTNDPNEYFTVDWNSVSKNERRSNYVILHSLYTLSMICSALNDLIVGKENLSPREKLEALGRLLFASKRFEQDVIRVLNLDILSKEGLLLIKELSISVHKVVQKHKPDALKVNLMGHDYDFSTITFFKMNNLQQ